MTGWPAFAVVVGCFAGFIGWGFRCQRRMDAAEQVAKRARLLEDMRVAQYRDAYNAAVEMERDLTEWEAEMRQGNDR